MKNGSPKIIGVFLYKILDPIEIHYIVPAIAINKVTTHK